MLILKKLRQNIIALICTFCNCTDASSCVHASIGKSTSLTPRLCIITDYMIFPSPFVVTVSLQVGSTLLESSSSIFSDHDNAYAQKHLFVELRVDSKEYLILWTCQMD
mgnify:CR=1 FL=1